MSTAAESLALATAGTCGLDDAGGGGVPRFTRAEIGHALAGLKRGNDDYEALPDGAVRVLLLRYADGGERDRAKLLDDLVHDACMGKDWEAQVAHFTVSRQAMLEFLSTSACGVCEGRGTCLVDARVESCDTCDGTGHKQLSAAARARSCGLPYETYRRGPAERYYLGRLKTLYRWEEIGVRRVAGKISSRDSFALTTHLRRVLTKCKQGSLSPVLKDTVDAAKQLPIVGEYIDSIPGERGLHILAPKTTQAELNTMIEKLLDTYPEA